MSTDHATLYLLDTAEGRPKSRDTVWTPLEEATYLVAPAHLGCGKEHPEELVIDVVGTLPAAQEGWSLLLG